MPVARFQMPDGRVARFDVPEGTSPEQATSMMEEHFGLSTSADTAPQQYQIGEAGLPKAVSDVAGNFNPLSKLAIGAAAGVGNAAMRLKQLFGNQFTPEDIREIQANRAFLNESPVAVIGSAVPAFAASLPFAPATLAGSAALGGSMGALSEPVLPGESGIKNAALGAVGGMAGNALMRGAARVVRPILPTNAAQKLMTAGVQPTMGQAAGGMLSSLEQKAQSIPITGEIISAARARPTEEFNKAALNLAMPKGSKVADIGRTGLEEVKGALSSAYDAVFSGKNVKPNAALLSSLQSAKVTPTLPLNTEGERAFDSVIRKVVLDRIPQNGVLAADSVKQEMIGDLGKQAQRMLRSPIAAESAVGEALMAARNNLQQWLVGEIASASPQAAAQLAKIDPLYAVRIALGKATDRAVEKGGVFTPGQALRSSKPGSSLFGLAENAKPVLNQTVADSGTAGRGFLAWLAMHPTSLVNPAEYAGIPLASVLYSRPGAAYMTGNLIPGQNALANALRSAAPYSAIAGADIATRNNLLSK